MREIHDPVGSALRLERAKELLDAGAYGRALRLLEKPMPRSLAGERSFLVAEALRSRGFLTRAAKIYECRMKKSAEPVERIESALARTACLRSLGRARPARRAWALLCVTINTV